MRSRKAHGAGERRAVVTTCEKRVAPPIRLGAGSNPLAGLRLFYSAGDPTKRGRMS